ncbi:serine esterase [Plasmopara halstedii]|uniref:Serine esterase n=1 Tax=Plasmopara halstedii TaxID=4781 RepID=A0A0P1B2L2_PLAHL|nr:serine esterase [Plasmopara halstedii]CEG48998.1 serine esterase [Plasmopara halstedii]|eukprot:XP_024585367.1 serine esterase [Plasmopara halstedii]
MTEAPTAVQPQTAANTKFYMKNAIFSMVSLYLAHQFASYLSNREEPIVCDRHVNDQTWFSERRYESLRFFDPSKTHHETQYVSMRDSVDLAVDFYLADHLWDKQEKVPTVLFPTRHGRGYTLNFPFNIFTRYKRKFTNPRVNAYVQRFVTNGYAWVSVDIRGTGASAGSKVFDFADAEVQDGYDMIEWIIRQSWSNGEVAVFGQGLDGVGALLVAASGHPALKAVSVNSAPIDVFQAALFPGGVKNLKALNDWASFTGATDRQIRWDHIPTFKARLMLKHFGGEVYRVDDNDSKFNQYIHQHMTNPDLSRELQHVRFRNDKFASINVTMEQMDATRHLATIAASGVAIQTSAGFFDMGVARSSILLFQYLTNTLDAGTASLLPELPKEAVRKIQKDATYHRLTLGPWSHAGVDNADPFAQSKQKCFYHLDEVSRFFDYHMYANRRKITKIDEELPVHYFTMAHNRWKESKSWPPAYLRNETLYLGANKLFKPEVETKMGKVSQNVTTKPTLDTVTRWSMLDHLFGLRPMYYHDRTTLAYQYLTLFTSELPLTEITGEAELRLFFSVDQRNVSLVAYLEDVDHTSHFPNENKRPGVTYMTEALVNPLHKTIHPDSSVYSYKRADSREIVPGQVYEAVFRFEPTSYVVKRDHQIRVSVGVATPPDFASHGVKEATKLTIYSGVKYPTKLILPSYTGLYDANVVPRTEELDDLNMIVTPDTVDTENYFDEAADTNVEL